MPRGILDHIVVRGIAGRKIFYDDQNMRIFLDRLRDVLQATKTAGVWKPMKLCISLAY